MKRATGSLGVAGRLAVLLGGLAAVSTGLALVLQDRALDQDLRGAARARLANSASVADRLIADHLQSTVTRYAAISRTPELRANLDTHHAPTLNFYASRLLRDQGAMLIAFVGTDGQFLATAGDPRLVRLAVARNLEPEIPDPHAWMRGLPPDGPARRETGPPASIRREPVRAPSSSPTEISTR